MRFFGILSAVLAFLITVVMANATHQKIMVIEPLENSLFEGELLYVSIKLSDNSIDQIKIVRNSADVLEIPVSKPKDYFCKPVKLEFGPNDITVSALVKGRVVESRKVTVFYRSDISKEYSFAPPVFQKKPFHQAGREVVCIGCHKLEASEKDINPKKPEDSMCYQCHKGITAYTNVHGPAARWDCLVCHDKESAPAKYNTRKPDRELCYICHNEKKEEWTPKKYVHGPTATGKCTICHNPHASNNQFWLKKPAWHLCVGCHEDMASGTHVVQGHPTKGKPDPLHYGKELSCASCHTPHAANTRALFVKDVRDPFDLCRMCHKNR